MIKIKQAIVVEGRYDKSKLASIFDTAIIVTGGFEIFKDRDKLAMLRILAEKNGLIILTDSDVAGFRIRRYLSGAIDPRYLQNVYIPQIAGKERRKNHASKEGLLGVEGMTKEAILKAFSDAGIIGETLNTERRRITKLDFYNDGLTGGTQSAKRRQQLIKRLGFPTYLSTNSLIDVLNQCMNYEEYCRLVKELDYGVKNDSGL